MIQKMRKAPLVSVIIPTLNCEDCLETALRSVIHQTYKHIELIIIDGGSTDRSLEIIHQYKENITYQISEPDNGIYDAMNKGVSMATGDWVYFLGADDILVNCLHKVSRYLKSIKTIYYGDVYLPNKNKTYDGNFTAAKLKTKNICHQAIFYPLNVFKKYQYSEKYPRGEDHLLNMKLWGDRWYKFKYIPFLIAIFNDKKINQGDWEAFRDHRFEKDRESLAEEFLTRDLKIYRVKTNLIKPLVLAKQYLQRFIFGVEN